MTPAANCSGVSLDRVALEPLGDQAARAFQIESEVSTQKALRLQSAEKQIGIRHRGLSAAAVADRAGIGSGGFGPDAERAGGVEAGDGTSARAHGVNVEHGHADGQAGNLGLAAGAGLTVHQRDIGGSSAHIERDDAVEAAAARHGSGPDHSARRAGKHGAHRFAGRRTEAGDSAARLHDENAGLSRAGSCELRARRSRFSR